MRGVLPRLSLLVPPSGPVLNLVYLDYVEPKHKYTIAHLCISDATFSEATDFTQILKTNMVFMKCSPCIQWFSCSKESPSPAAQRDVVERIESPGCWAALEAEEPGSHPHTSTHPFHDLSTDTYVYTVIKTFV